LAFRCIWAIFALVVLGSDFVPVGGKDGTSTSLEALDHSTTSILIRPFVNRFEKRIQSRVTLRLFLLRLLFGYLLINAVPVLFVL
jgi:hypothetical protein